MSRLLLEEMCRPAKEAHWRIRYERERSLGFPWPLVALAVPMLLYLFRP